MIAYDVVVVVDGDVVDDHIERMVMMSWLLFVMVMMLLINYYCYTIDGIVVCIALRMMV
jgi:hypothetical protein